MLDVKLVILQVWGLQGFRCGVRGRGPEAKGSNLVSTGFLSESDKGLGFWVWGVRRDP